jgi:transmembrane sensor
MTEAQASPVATREDEAAAWWLKLQADEGLLTADDGDAFDAWLAADPANDAALQRCATAWNSLDALAGTPKVVALRADALEHMRRANQRHWAKPFRLGGSAYAAAAALILSVGGGVWYLSMSNTDHLTTGISERRTLALADGSHLSMDAKTQIGVTLSSDQRRLQIDAGRAKFDVAAEPNRPFTVEAGGHIVVATGTSFSTERVDGKLHVIVYEGKVVVLNGAMPDPQTLLALRNHPVGGAVALLRGQEFVVQDGASRGVVRSDVPGSANWENGMLEFIEEPLSDAVAQLNRYSTRAMVVTDARAAAIKVDGVFEAGQTDAFVEAMARVYPVRTRRRADGTIEISSRD